MNQLLSTFVFLFLLSIEASCLYAQSSQTSRGQGTLVPLFESNRFDAWSTTDGSPVPSSWEVKDGVIHLNKGEIKGGNIVTKEEFGDFVLEFEFKIAPKGNSGIKYRVQRYGQRFLGFEYQVYDDVQAKQVAPKNRTGSIYDLYEPVDSVKPNPSGEWNLARVEATGSQIVHYLNGSRVVSATIGNEDWNKRLSQSKFAETNGFGETPKGRIMLTDHGSEVWYRNFVLRVTKP